MAPTPTPTHTLLLPKKELVSALIARHLDSPEDQRRVVVERLGGEWRLSRAAILAWLSGTS